MCNHHYLIEYRPDPEDYGTWEDIETIDIGGGRRVDTAEQQRGLKLARQVAADYALAHYERAPNIVITRMSCNGPEGTERPYEREWPESPTRRANDEVESSEFYKQLEAVMLKLRAEGDETGEDAVLDAMDLLYRRDAGPTVYRLAQQNVQLRAALTRYSDPSAWRVRAAEREPGRLTVELPISADAGAAARAALRGEELPEAGR